MFPYSAKQKQEFLNRFGQKVLIQDQEQLGIIEKEITNQDGIISETIYITADELVVSQDYKVQIKDNIYRIAYIVDDGSGLVNCYLSIKSDTKGRVSKYE